MQRNREKKNRIGKTRDLFKRIRDTKGTFHAKMGTIKDRNYRVSLVAQRLKCLPPLRETWVQSLGWEDSPGEGNGNPTPVLLPGESLGQRSLVGYTVHGVAASNTTERLTHTHTHTLCVLVQI